MEVRRVIPQTVVCPECGASSDPDSEQLPLLIEEYVCVQSHVLGLGEAGEVRVQTDYQLDWEDRKEARVFCPNCGHYWPIPGEIAFADTPSKKLIQAKERRT